MKKTMIGLLALVSLGLTGCGGGDEKADTSKSAEKKQRLLLVSILWMQSTSKKIWMTSF